MAGDDETASTGASAEESWSFPCISYTEAILTMSFQVTELTCVCDMFTVKMCQCIISTT